ncbi:uncharacterized protein DUF4320 [Paenibacillus pabuli]|uniref:Uncharacterized protein DUF4320 n=1 Tax=Paenibacillus pabuli TaxID=1472 RepID=A0ABX9BEW3_9BACL|nr:DUF4320 family protein [Paenibacillus pabuli]RAI89603.1 uncharacterized protein DUF4320 [Paenibacillus pabuli]
MKFKIWLAPLRNNRGAVGSIPLMFFVMVASVFLYLGIDVYGYISQQQKLTIASNELLEVIKAENGFDAVNREQFDRLLQKTGIDPAKVTLTATSKRVDRGDPVTVEASMVYECIGLKPLGKTVKLSIRVEANGLAHTFFR